MKLAAFLALMTGALTAQIPNPTQQQATAPTGTAAMPIFRVTVVSRTTKAVNYHHRNGSTRIDFRGTELMPAAMPTNRGGGAISTTTVRATLAMPKPKPIMCMGMIKKL